MMEGEGSEACSFTPKRGGRRAALAEGLLDASTFPHIPPFNPHEHLGELSSMEADPEARNGVPVVSLGGDPGGSRRDGEAAYRRGGYPGGSWSWIPLGDLEPGKILPSGLCHARGKVLGHGNISSPAPLLESCSGRPSIHYICLPYCNIMPPGFFL